MDLIAMKRNWELLLFLFQGQWGSFGLDEEIGSCSILPDPVTRRSPKEFLFVVAFVLPCLAIVVCYARIFFIVRRAAAVSHGRDQQQQQQMQAAGGGGQLMDSQPLKPSASVRSKTGIGGIIPGEMTRRGLMLPGHHHHHLASGSGHSKLMCRPAEASFQLTCCESQQVIQDVSGQQSVQNKINVYLITGERFNGDKRGDDRTKCDR